MTKKILKISLIIVVSIIFILALAFLGLMVYTKRQLDRGDLVKWNNKFYTKEELKEKFPPWDQDAPAKNTPEQVYAEFRQALLDNDIKRALGLIREESREEYKILFSNQEILEKYVKLPEVSEINKSETETYGNFTSYYYSEIIDNKNITYSIEFIKDQNGYWQIDKI